MKKLKLWELPLNIKDNVLRFIEVKSGQLHNWAWDRRWKDRDPKEWLREYREWKKTHRN